MLIRSSIGNTSTGKYWQVHIFTDCGETRVEMLLRLEYGGGSLHLKASDKQLLLESVEREIGYQDMREPAKHANSGYRVYFPRGKPKSRRPRNSKLLEAG